jgi:hypothetical protein
MKARVLKHGRVVAVDDLAPKRPRGRPRKHAGDETHGKTGDETHGKQTSRGTKGKTKGK